ncbi:zinc ribbon domain-containing protein [Candidatus Enterococcus leclercqii]|uniref:zinc ribbon domain-containing protein n=1 Tax=Candidatus Enterococcus leclercqii TaxID=1857218 RepID=UPI00137A59BD|nr:zinc ribbon domain-containing protein [Enterococcus sp. CU9D]KAF1294176.1 hypothetical protein BAU14_07245 [Enterococcus sp. CU9D]
MGNMKNCPKCGQELAPNALFCPNCGQKLTDESAEAMEKKTVQLENEGVGKRQDDRFQNNQLSVKTPNPIVEKFIIFIKKYRIPLVIAAVALIAIIGFFNYVNSRPVDISGNVKVTFDGYDSQGVANYNSDKIYSEISEKAYEKAGFKEKDAEGILNGDGTIIDKLQKVSGYASRLGKAASLIQNVQIKMNKTESLKNGDKVVLTIKDNNEDKDKFIKDSKKEFTVKGLKGIESFTAEDLLKDVKYSFSGYDGFGKLTVTDNPYSNETESIFTNQYNDSNYSNGDKVTLEIEPNLIASESHEGRVFEGDTFIETEVKNLKSINDIEKKEDILKQIDTYAKAQNKSNDYRTYQVERVESYLRVTDEYNYWGNSNDAEINCEIQSIYKITDTETTGDKKEAEVYYEIYGYSIVPVKGNAFQAKDLSGGSSYSWGQEKSVEDCVNTLKADHPDFEKI